MSDFRKQLLLIEDNKGDARLIQELLKETSYANWDLEWREILQAGLQKLEESDVALILLDLSLPDSQGLDTIKQVVQKSPDVPIIIMTGHHDDLMGIDAVRKGAQDYLIKDEVNARILERSISYAMERHVLLKKLKETQEECRLDEIKIRDQYSTLKGIMESSDNPVFSVDMNYCYTSFNRSHADTMKNLYSAEIELGKSILDYQTVEEDRVSAKINIDRALHGERLVEEAYSGEKELNRSYFEVSHYPIRDNQGEVVGVAVNARDITDLKNSQQALISLNAELEVRIEERTKSLEEAQERMMRQEKLAAIGKLAGSVGHELRNPLGVITNSIYYLGLKLPATDEKITKHLRIIQEEATKASKIISDLLDFGRMRPNESYPVDICGLIKDTLEQVQKPENITLDLNFEPELLKIKIDPRKLQQVFQNIITNAYQAMPDGGILTIQLKNDAGEIEIGFKDTGVGISPKNLPRLFEPLFSTKIKGIGLGLSIAKEIVEQYGGRIEVESDVGVGSIFIVKLPISDNAGNSRVIKPSSEVKPNNAADVDREITD